MRVNQGPGNEFGAVLHLTDFRKFLTATEGPKNAATSARDAMGQLLKRVERADFICLLCKKRRGQCWCPTQGTESARYPGAWVYYEAPQRWVVTRVSLVSLTGQDLIPLSNRAHQRMRAWLQHLRRQA